MIEPLALFLFEKINSYKFAIRSVQFIKMEPPFEVCMRIGYYIHDPKAFQNWASVSKAAARAARHLRTLKEYQFQTLYVGFKTSPLASYPPTGDYHVFERPPPIGIIQGFERTRDGEIWPCVKVGQDYYFPKRRIDLITMEGVKTFEESACKDTPNQWNWCHPDRWGH